MTLLPYVNLAASLESWTLEELHTIGRLLILSQISHY